MRFFLLTVFVLMISCSTSHSVTLSRLMQEYTVAYFQLNPDIAMEKGIGAQFGISVPDRFTDTSLNGIKKEYKLVNSIYEKLQRIDSSALTGKELIYYKVFKSYLETRREEEHFMFHWYVLNPMFSVHTSMVTLITESLPVTTQKDVKRYLSRMKQIPIRLSHEKSKLEYQNSHKILPSRSAADSYLNSIDSFIKTPVQENPLYVTLKSKIEKLSLNPEEQKKILADCETIITHTVYPAYREYAQYVGTVRDTCDDIDGVWKLPDGEAYYAFSLKYHTSSNKTPDEIHTTGIHEVERLQKEITSLMRTVGIAPRETFQKTLFAYWDHCSKNPEMGYPETEEGKQHTIRDYRLIIDETEKKLDALFSLLPKTKVTTEPVPLYKEKTSGTYYQPAPADGSAKGVFYANLGYSHFKPDMPALTYHESIPGHHLQLAIQQEVGLPLFFAIPFFTAYIEGWALYAEQLAFEEGWYPDVYSRISYLHSALFRAARMVVDTGIHYKRWTREESRGYMERTVGWGGDGQIDRYSTWPGQACAYMHGKLALLALRHKTKEKLGSSFDIREFHTAILEHGAVPLPLLDDIVDTYYSHKP